MHKRFFSLVLLAVLILSGCSTGASSPAVPSPTGAVLPTNTLTLIPLPTEEPTSTPEPELVITVNTADDIVDSTSTSMEALIAAPGPDGLISLREAFQAANETSGKKRIVFDAGLRGQTIVLQDGQQRAEPRLIITGESITLDGDIDEDGQPDITLDGSRMNTNYSSAFLVSSRDITIENLILRGFQQYAFIIACIDPTCSTKPFQHIRIRNNQVYSDNGGGVVVSPLNINGPMDDLALFSDNETSDLEVAGNVFEITGGLNAAIFMQAAGAGVSRNTLADVVIQGNRIRSPGATITVNGADANSSYYGFPGPVVFSDDSIVENVEITDNILDPQGVGGDGTRPTGVIMLAGNMGNSGNTIRGVEISGNEVSSNAEYGIAIHATMIDSSSYLSVPEGASTENAVEDVLVEGNTIHAWMGSIIFHAATGEYYVPTAEESAEPGETGRLSNIRILSNNLLDYQFEAIDIFGGVGASDNRVENLRIEDNIITSKDPTKGVAFYVYAGGCSNCTVVSERNQITALVIQGNTVTCDNLIWLSGGVEEYASDNLVEYYLGENDVTPADAVVSIEDSAYREVQGNRAVRLDAVP